jgi:hypothetical protein
MHKVYLFHVSSLVINTLSELYSRSALEKLRIMMLLTPLTSQAYPGTHGSIKSRVACWITVSGTPYSFSASMKRAIDMPEYRYSSLRNPSLMYDFSIAWYSVNPLSSAIFFIESTTSAGTLIVMDTIGWLSCKDSLEDSGNIMLPFLWLYAGYRNFCRKYKKLYLNLNENQEVKYKAFHQVHNEKFKDLTTAAIQAYPFSTTEKNVVRFGSLDVSGDEPQSLSYAAFLLPCVSSMGGLGGEPQGSPALTRSSNPSLFRPPRLEAWQVVRSTNWSQQS